MTVVKRRAVQDPEILKQNPEKISPAPGLKYSAPGPKIFVIAMGNE